MKDFYVGQIFIYKRLSKFNMTLYSLILDIKVIAVFSFIHFLKSLGFITFLDLIKYTGSLSIYFLVYIY